MAKTPTHIKHLVPDGANRRKHNPRNIGMVVDALHQVGAARSIVIDEGNVVLAGNGVIEAAAEAGITKVQVVDVDGTTIVAVRRKGLTADQKRSLAIFDNRTAELAEWNLDQIQADAVADLDLSTFWRLDELAAVLADQNRTDGAGPPAADPMADRTVPIGQAAVIVLCADEAEQRRVYEDLTARGLTCKVVNT